MRPLFAENSLNTKERRHAFLRHACLDCFISVLIVAVFFCIGHFFFQVKENPVREQKKAVERTSDIFFISDKDKAYARFLKKFNFVHDVSQIAKSPFFYDESDAFIHGKKDFGYGNFDILESLTPSAPGSDKNKVGEKQEISVAVSQDDREIFSLFQNQAMPKDEIITLMSFPVWTDMNGNFIHIPDNENNQSKNEKNDDNVTGPTVLSVDVRHEKQLAIYSVSVLQTGGSSHSGKAQRMLEKYLYQNEKKATALLQGEQNYLIYVYWNKKSFDSAIQKMVPKDMLKNTLNTSIDGTEEKK